MPRRMSCSLTIDAVRARLKTVTRRHESTWCSLAAGDRLTLIERGMGLARGERQVVLADVEVVDVRLESLAAVTAVECVAEGFAEMNNAEFVVMWLAAHGYPERTPASSVIVRRIEWRYLSNPTETRNLQ